MSEANYSNEMLIFALMCFFNAQPKMEEEFGSEMAERQRLDLLNGLERQKISLFTLKGVVIVAAERSRNREAKETDPVAIFERLIGEKIENIAAS